MMRELYLFFFCIFVNIYNFIYCFRMCLCVFRREQMRTSWVMQGIKRSPEGGYILAFNTPEGPKRLQAKVAVCTAPAHRLTNVEGLRVRTRKTFVSIFFLVVLTSTSIWLVGLLVDFFRMT